MVASNFYLLEESKMGKIEALWRKILEEIGEDPDREGLRDTPRRIAKMYQEVFRGYFDLPPNITTFDPEGSGGLIIDKGYYFSHCEHHAVPFFGNYYYGYIPKQRIVGASKIGRVVDYFSARMQIAERLCKNVVDYIEEAAEPAGSILIMTGRHLCKEMRGLKKYDVPFEVIEARGILLKNENGCKDEFLSRIINRI